MSTAVQGKQAWLPFGVFPERKGAFKGKVDLHQHSRHSDGNPKMSVRDMALAAAYYGFSAVALTDHASIAGQQRYISTCQQHGLTVLTGVEILTMNDNGDKLDVLGYGYNPSAENLSVLLASIQDQVARGVVNVVNWVNENLGEYQALRSRMGEFPRLVRPNEEAISEAETKNIIARAGEWGMVKGLIADLLLEKGFFAPTPQQYFPNARAFRFLDYPFLLFPYPVVHLDKAQEAIHADEGLVFVAHSFGRSDFCPKNIARSLEITTERYLSWLLDKYNFDGLEAVHSDHSAERVAYLTRLAQSRGLLISGGSDTHWKSPNRVLGISPERALHLQTWMREKRLRG